MQRIFLKNISLQNIFHTLKKSFTESLHGNRKNVIIKKIQNKGRNYSTLRAEPTKNVQFSLQILQYNESNNIVLSRSWVQHDVYPPS